MGNENVSQSTDLGLTYCAQHSKLLSHQEEPKWVCQVHGIEHLNGLGKGNGSPKGNSHNPSPRIDQFEKLQCFQVQRLPPQASLTKSAFPETILIELG